MQVYFVNLQNKRTSAGAEVLSLLQIMLFSSAYT